ncbi:PA14 domain-containing protein [Ferrovibrio sp.]|uniref:PA14 domain-containing protein n=1 Tax=Ferrovibrio sp. TaxID=1917215 RepID=UPI0035AED06F
MRLSFPWQIGRILKVQRFVVAAMMLALAGCASGAGGGKGKEVTFSADAVKPAMPQPAAASLKPGLATMYFHGRYDHINDMPSLDKPVEMAKGRPGKPVAPIDEMSGSGVMWESQDFQFFGVVFTGFINFDKPGTYHITVNSNDGIRIYIGGKMVLEDPFVHADAMANPVALDIAAPGWYPITMQYFQKRNTATLQFFWQPPNANNMSIIPASALMHVPK